MRSVYVDSAVFVHALGREEILRNACTEFLARVRSRDIPAQTAVLTVEEVVHVRNRQLGDRARAARDGRNISAMVGLQEVTRHDLDRALVTYVDRSRLDARDAVHAAVAERLKLDTIVTTDADFDGLPGLRRVDPRDRDEIAQLADSSSR